MSKFETLMLEISNNIRTRVGEKGRGLGLGGVGGWVGRVGRARWGGGGGGGEGVKGNGRCFSHKPESA